MHDPEAKSDAEYTTQQAANRCGISINTLLAWERRYGVPSPRRNDRDERVYSAEDLFTIRWLQERTAQGMPIGKAVQLFHATQNAEPASDDVVVALDVAPSRLARERPLSRERSPQDNRSHWQRELTNALLTLNRAAVTTVLGAAALESSPLIATQEVVLPVMKSLIARYDAGAIDLAIVTLAERWLGNRIAHWLDVAIPPKEHARALTVLVPDDRHWSAVPSLAIALRLAHDGHHIIDLPADAPIELIQTVAEICAANQVLLIESEDRRTQQHRVAVLRQVLPPTVSVATIPLEGEADEAGTTFDRQANDRSKPAIPGNQQTNRSNLGPEAAT